MGATSHIFFMKQWLKWLIGGGLLSGACASIVGLAVGCTATFGNTTITINGNGLSWYNKETPDDFNQNSYKVSTSDSNLEPSTPTTTSNTLNLPLSVSYNKQKIGACVFTLISPKVPANQISRISWNSQDQMWALYDGSNLVGKYWTPTSTSFIFEITITPTNSALHLTTNIYYCKVVLKNVV